MRHNFSGLFTAFHPAQEIKLVIWADTGHVSQSVRKRKEAADGAYIPDVFLAKPLFLKQCQVGFTNFLGPQGDLDGIVQHCPLAPGNIGFSVVSSELIGNQGVFLPNP